MFKLIVVHPFKKYVRGQVIADQDEVAKHLVDREHHFVRVRMTDDEIAATSKAAKPEAAKPNAAKTD